MFSEVNLRLIMSESRYLIFVLRKYSAISWLMLKRRTQLLPSRAGFPTVYESRSCTPVRFGLFEFKFESLRLICSVIVESAYCLTV
jgi:hypothetical protein